MNENPYQSSESTQDRSELKKQSGFWSFLKKVLIGLGIFFGLIIALIIWAGVATTKTYNKFDGLAEPFINEFLNEQNPWDYEKAKEHLSPAWLEASTDEQNLKLFKYFNKLGAIQSVGTIEWLGCVSNASTEGSVERCNYNVSANYENGVAAIYFGLSLEAEQVKLMQLKVNSEAFLE